MQEEIGEISVEALRLGEDFLDLVEKDLGVALRHSKRITEGVFRFTPTIEAEMRFSIKRARQRVEAKRGEKQC